MINNNNEEGYKLLFEKINYNLTIEKIENWELKSHIIDFEKAIINVTSEISTDKGQIQCYYYYF